MNSDIVILYQREIFSDIQNIMYFFVAVTIAVIILSALKQFLNSVNS